MYSDIHTDFILSPLSETLLDGIKACSPVSIGIENQAMGEYFLQALFLRMTGAQEQKMKCICWTLASNNYQYRYEFLNKKNYGECSDYATKQEIYKDLVRLIKESDGDFIPTSIFDNECLPDGLEDSINKAWKQRVDKKRVKDSDAIIRKKEEKGVSLSGEIKNKIRMSFLNKPYPIEDFHKRIIKERKDVFIKNVVLNLIGELNKSPLPSWEQRGFILFREKYQDVINAKQITTSDNELFGSNLQKYYKKVVYDHRNRTAHNTMSYQKDLPSFSSLAEYEYVYNNYFFRFAILIVLDEIFMRLFRCCRERLYNKII